MAGCGTVSRKSVADNDTAPSYSRSTLLGREPSFSFPEGVRAKPRRLEEPSCEYEVYVAVRGDSYWSIARKFNVSLDELLQANGATKTSVLMVGQGVQIPVHRGNVGGEIYTVRQGDSLSSIARERKCSVEDLRSLNELSSDLLMVGQRIRVPSLSLSPRPERFLSAATLSDGKTYTVRRGDTLSLIAAGCGMEVREIMEINDIVDPNRIREGQRLVLRRLPTDSGVVNHPRAPVSAPASRAQPDVDLLKLFDSEDLFGVPGVK